MRVFYSFCALFYPLVLTLFPTSSVVKRPLFIRVCVLQITAYWSIKVGKRFRCEGSFKYLGRGYSFFTTLLYLECVIDMDLCPFTMDILDIPLWYNVFRFQMPYISSENYNCNIYEFWMLIVLLSKTFFLLYWINKVYFMCNI